MYNYRIGTSIPCDGSYYKRINVEVGIELGMILSVEAEVNDGKINLDSVKSELKEKIIDIFDIDNKDKVLNNICIYTIQ